ncbi:MAG: transcriptional regulator [Selenomonadaceae bacterium]|nr:transcriptional regulator [Selenomonadaceae bacterium]
MAKNDDAWEKLFDEHKILSHVEREGFFRISADQIRKFREPRLMTKFDHRINLPKIFSSNELSILPVTRGDYLISHFEAWKNFEPADSAVLPAELPEYLQSLDAKNIFSEALALNCAFASGIIADFTGDENIFSTVSGRMSSGTFDFKVNDTRRNFSHAVHVNNSQIEIDAAFEGIKFLTLIEAKRDLADDFLIRQLYYPYRTWQNKISKPIKPIFLVYSNGIFYLREYAFAEPENYNSLVLVQQKKYSVESTKITLADIQEILRSVKPTTEPPVPFPQADKFERVINICELLNEKSLNRNDVTAKYDFDSRQTNYYTDAARYLGLIEKSVSSHAVTYNLSDLGRKILRQSFRERQLSYCKCILSHKVFADTLKASLERGAMLSTAEIIALMKNSNLYQIGSDETFKRRSSTITSWLNWIIGLIDD